MIKIWWALGAAMLVLLLSTVWIYFHPMAKTLPASEYGHAVVTVNGQKVTAEIPLTTAASSLGLGGRKVLTDEQGMLWEFEAPQRPSFWMKGMLIDLDFLWLKEGKVVEIMENVPAPTDTTLVPPTFQPAVEVDAILEVPAGFAQRYGIITGQAAQIDRF